MEKSNKLLNSLTRAWDSLAQYVNESISEVTTPEELPVDNTTQRPTDHCDLKITSSDLVSVDKANAFKNQVADFVERNQKKDPSLTKGICEFTLLEYREFDAVKIAEYEKRGAQYDCKAIADYRSNNDTIRVQDPHNKEWVLNHEAAHHWDLGSDKHQNQGLQKTIDQYKDVSWVEFCDEELGDSLHPLEERELIYTQDFARKYGATDHLEDWATGVETVLQDPIRQCEHIDQVESSLWTHKADIICENDQIVSSKKSRFSEGEDYFYLTQNRVEKILKREGKKSHRIVTENFKGTYVSYRNGKEGGFSDITHSILPKGFDPINTEMIDSNLNLLVAGYDQEDNFVVYRMRKGFSSKGESIYFVTGKDLMGVPKGWPRRKFSGGSPCKDGFVYAFHSKDYKQTGLVYYDLKTNRLHLLKNQKDFLEKHFSEIKKIYDKDGKLYALGKNHQGKNIVMNLKIDL